jgi:hypothetical protein
MTISDNEPKPERCLSQAQVRVLERMHFLRTSMASKNDRTLQSLAERGLVRHARDRWHITPAGMHKIAPYIGATPPPPPNPFRFVLVGGEAPGADGQVHYISPARLADLYGLRPGEWTPHTLHRRSRPGDILLTPQLDGNYRLPHPPAYRARGQP